MTQDIYMDLIHNENNMRPTEINSLFKISALDNVCLRVASTQYMLDYFEETEAGKAHGQLLPRINDFMERRNEIAHALGRRRSDGPDQILKDIKMLDSFGHGLCAALNEDA